jgi:hypothetical protein
MFTHDDVLMPLAITVIIDTKVRDAELAEFCRQALGLIELFDLEPMHVSDLQKWFSDHRDEVAKTLGGPRRNTLVLRALSKFKDDVHMENIYDAMVQISICDQEYRPEESDLVKSAAVLWGYDRPPLKINRD